VRRTQNIFFYLARADFKGFWWCIRYFDKYRVIDSWAGIMKLIICKISHKPRKPNYNEHIYDSYDIFCKRCHKYLKTLTHEQAKQYIREQKLKRIL